MGINLSKDGVVPLWMMFYPVKIKNTNQLDIAEVVSVTHAKSPGCSPGLFQNYIVFKT